MSRLPQTFFSRIVVVMCAILLVTVSASTGLAQKKQPAKPQAKSARPSKAKQQADDAAAKANMEDMALRPIYVAMRAFQMKAKRGTYQELNDQVFKMNTSSLADYDQWISNFKNLYPEFEIDLLRTDTKRVFRTAKPASVSLVKQPDGRFIEIQLFGAQSYGDGVTPGTSLVPEIALHFGDDKLNKPLTYSITPLEIESGKTYFFAVKSLKMQSTDFVNFVRPGAPAESLDGNDIYLLFSFSVDLDKTTVPARMIDEQQSVAFQETATKKVIAEVPDDFRKAGMGGYVRVRVNVSPEGTVTSPDVQYSSFPEMNKLVVEAVRKWEFPKSHFESDKNPITSYITFSYPAQPPNPKPTSTAKQ
jgi:TonB family protein